jgi:hypothetical protein
MHELKGGEYVLLEVLLKYTLVAAAVTVVKVKI